MIIKCLHELFFVRRIARLNIQRFDKVDEILLGFGQVIIQTSIFSQKGQIVSVRRRIFLLPLATFSKAARIAAS